MNGGQTSPPFKADLGLLPTEVRATDMPRDLWPHLPTIQVTSSLTSSVPFPQTACCWGTESVAPSAGSEGVECFSPSFLV